MKSQLTKHIFHSFDFGSILILLWKYMMCLHKNFWTTPGLSLKIQFNTKMNNLIHNRDLIWKENSNKSSIPPGYFDKCNMRSCSWQSLRVISWPVTVILTIGLELASTKLSNKSAVFDPWGDTYELGECFCLSEL